MGVVDGWSVIARCIALWFVSYPMCDDDTTSEHSCGTAFRWGNQSQSFEWGDFQNVTHRKMRNTEAMCPFSKSPHSYEPMSTQGSWILRHSWIPTTCGASIWSAEKGWGTGFRSCRTGSASGIYYCGCSVLNLVGWRRFNSGYFTCNYFCFCTNDRRSDAFLSTDRFYCFFMIPWKISHLIISNLSDI